MYNFKYSHALAVIIKRLEAHLKAKPQNVTSYLVDRVNDIHYMSSKLLVVAREKHAFLSAGVDGDWSEHWSWHWE